MREALAEAIAAFPDRLVTLADWAALPEQEIHRLEVTEGVLTVAPHPPVAHQHIATRLAAQVAAGLPAQLQVLPSVELLLTEEPLTILVPDLLVAHTPNLSLEQPRLHPSQVALAVEVLAPGTRRADQVTKPTAYADAGIEQYWTIDSETEADPGQRGSAASTTTVISSFALPAAGRDETTSATGRGNRAYQHLGTYTTPATLRIAGHPISIDPTGLTPRQPGTSSP